MDFAGRGAKAWDVFSVLENSYFGQPEIETPFEMDEDAEKILGEKLF